jgi:hypothetical protein
MKDTAKKIGIIVIAVVIAAGAVLFCSGIGRKRNRCGRS